MVAKFKDGDRVLIAGSYDWGTGGIGTVRSPHVAVTDRTGRWIDEVASMEPGVDGPTLVYWVEFDAALPDRSKHGPYRAGSVEEAALCLISN